MYYYIYDQFLSEKRWDKTIADIESKLSLLEIKGPIGRLHPLTKMKDLVSRAITRGATTLVAVGNDATFLALMNALPQEKIACGYIPITSPNALGKVFSIANAEAGIEAVARRRLQSIHFGKANKRYFIRELTVQARDFTAILNEQLTLKCDRPRSFFTIKNPHFTENANYLICSHISQKKGFFSRGSSQHTSESKFFIKKLSIKSQIPMDVTIDDGPSEQAQSLVISVVPNALKIVIGKALQGSLATAA